MTAVTNDTPESEAARVLIDRQMLDYRTAIPGVVVSVSADGTTVDVQPAVSMAQTLDGETKAVHMPVLQGVPLMVYGSAALGLFVCAPVRPGDDGLLIVCDRAIDNWQHGEGVSMAPLGPSPRHHDLTDAAFIPGLQRASGAIQGYPTSAIELRNRAGTCKLALNDSGITITAPAVTINAPVTATSVTAPTITSNGKVLATHTHPVTTAPGTTGAPS